MSVFTDTNQMRQWLLELSARDVDAATTRTLRIGTRALLTEPGDTPANAYFAPRLAAPPVIDHEATEAGFADVVRGAFAIALTRGGDGQASNWDWADYAYDGQAFSLWVGLHGAAWSDHEKILTGRLGSPEIRDGMLILPVRGLLGHLDVPFQAATFAGTGGWDGVAGLAGITMPAIYGHGLNLPAELVDPVNKRFVFHDGAVSAIDDAYEGGNSLAAAFTGDTANGRITPTASPSYRLTVDVQGDAGGAGFVETTSEIVQRILVDRTDLTSGDLDSTSWNALASSRAGEIGYWTPAGDSRAVRDVVGDLMRAIGAWVDQDPVSGKLVCGLVALPSGDPDLVIRHTDMEDGRLAVVRELPPHSEVGILYAPNWLVMNREELAASVRDTEHAAFLAHAFRRTADDDSDVLTDYPEAKPAADKITFYRDKADADTQASADLAIRKKRRRWYECTIYGRGLDLRIGHVARVYHPDHGLAAGALMTVRGIRKRVAGDAVTLSLWRPMA